MRGLVQVIIPVGGGFLNSTDPESPAFVFSVGIRLVGFGLSVHRVGYLFSVSLGVRVSRAAGKHASHG